MEASHKEHRPPPPPPIVCGGTNHAPSIKEWTSFSLAGDYSTQKNAGSTTNVPIQSSGPLSQGFHYCCIRSNFKDSTLSGTANTTEGPIPATFKRREQNPGNKNPLRCAILGKICSVRGRQAAPAVFGCNMHFLQCAMGLICGVLRMHRFRPAPPFRGRITWNLELEMFLYSAVLPG